MKNINYKYFYIFVLTIILVCVVFLRLGLLEKFGDHLSASKSSKDFPTPKSALNLSSRDILATKSSRNTDRDIQDLQIEDLPLDIDEWDLSKDDLNLFSQLSEQLKEREVLRIVHEGYGYEKYVDESGETHGVLQETSIIRPPEPDERDKIHDDLAEALFKSSASTVQKKLIKMFFEEQFSLSEDDFKILTTNAIGSDDGRGISRIISVRLADNFLIEENENGEKYVQVRGRSKAESTYTNPSSRRAERYGHLVDPEAGE